MAGVPASATRPGAIARGLRRILGRFASQQRDADVLCRQGQNAVQAGELQRACHLFKEALRRSPDMHVARDALARAAIDLADGLEAAGDRDAACRVLEDAWHEPPSAALSARLGLLQLARGDAARAESLFGLATRADPSSTVLHYNRGLAMRASGRAAEATGFLDAALALAPADHGIASARLLTLQYRDDLDASAIAAEHFAYGERFHGVAAAKLAPEPGAPDRALRVGFVSADLGLHVVSQFLEPLFDAIDPAALEVTCYNAGTHDDAQTARLRARARAWRTISALDDEAAACCIRADRLDLCIDLSGHTGGNRLPVFARRVAPVQLTWLGYPDGTGLRTMDARITDAVADPPQTADRLYRERLVRLPGLLCYPGRPEAPPVTPLPCDSGQPFTFGCFNNLAKVSASALAAWVRVLDAVPGARLLLKSGGLDRGATAASLLRRWVEAGGDPARLAMEGHTPDFGSHLARYAAVDVALDSFPYNGTTTTCEALWMGVPVVSLAGERHAARVGASLLARIGRPEWVARDTAGFVEIAARLASDRTALAALRAGLRRAVMTSPLADATRFARDFERACRSLVAGC